MRISSSCFAENTSGSGRIYSLSTNTFIINNRSVPLSVLGEMQVVQHEKETRGGGWVETTERNTSSSSHELWMTGIQKRWYIIIITNHKMMMVESDEE